MTQLIEKVLFTSDLSEDSIRVFEKTVALAAQLGAAIVMLHVIEDGSSSTQNRMVHLVDREVYENIRRESRDGARNALIGKQRAVPVIHNALHALCKDTSRKVCRADLRPEIESIEVRYGDAAEVITELSETVDLVVMGYHKKGSLLRALMGSAGKGVIKRSRKPLFLVPLES